MGNKVGLPFFLNRHYLVMIVIFKHWLIYLRGKRVPGTHSVGGWVNTGAGLDD
jgi:hypothetical protein